jgi:hypothetical protein
MTAMQVNQLALRDVTEQFNLVKTKDPAFFPEWRETDPELDEQTLLVLSQIESDYEYLSQQVIDEGSVKLVVLGRLLPLAGLYQPPFNLVTEKTIEIRAEDEGQVFRGVVDILAMHKKMWVLLVEAKRNTFSLVPAMPQALAYMSGAPYPEYPTFGLVTNGENFLFLKLQGKVYATSRAFVMQNSGDLAEVLKVMRRLGETVRGWSI